MCDFRVVIVTLLPAGGTEVQLQRKVVKTAQYLSNLLLTNKYVMN